MLRYSDFSLVLYQLTVPMVKCYNGYTVMKQQLFADIRGVVYSAREAHNLTG